MDSISDGHSVISSRTSGKTTLVALFAGVATVAICIRVGERPLVIASLFVNERLIAPSAQLRLAVPHPQRAWYLHRFVAINWCPRLVSCDTECFGRTSEGWIDDKDEC
jgi:hypothetical protein